MGASALKILLRTVVNRHPQLATRFAHRLFELVSAEITETEDFLVYASNFTEVLNYGGHIVAALTFAEQAVNRLRDLGFEAGLITARYARFMNELWKLLSVFR